MMTALVFNELSVQIFKWLIKEQLEYYRARRREIKKPAIHYPPIL